MIIKRFGFILNEVSQGFLILFPRFDNILKACYNFASENEWFFMKESKMVTRYHLAILWLYGKYSTWLDDCGHWFEIGSRNLSQFGMLKNKQQKIEICEDVVEKVVHVIRKYFITNHI